ncbi:hypothetical protein Q3G72_003144 [Acer saccharum]|nr:hypothetical protein Q3G72_003144 [Acer saccharum]
MNDDLLLAEEISVATSLVSSFHLSLVPSALFHSSTRSSVDILRLESIGTGDGDFWWDGGGRINPQIRSLSFWTTTSHVASGLVFDQSRIQPHTSAWSLLPSSLESPEYSS